MCDVNAATVLTRPGASASEPVAALLEQLADVLGGIIDSQYVTKPVGVFRSSVGGHVRHCLDHVRALLAGLERGEIDYDVRERGTAVESDRSAAIDSARRLAAAVRSLPKASLPQALSVRVMLTADGRLAEFETTLGRELAFVFSHTIHHNAVVGAMVLMLGADLPAAFGYAPATIAHAGQACAR